jgi:hypothetical protein
VLAPMRFCFWVVCLRGFRQGNNKQGVGLEVELGPPPNISYFQAKEPQLHVISLHVITLSDFVAPKISKRYIEVIIYSRIGFHELPSPSGMLGVLCSESHFNIQNKHLSQSMPKHS